MVVRRATAKRLREEGERALSNDEYDKGFALLAECMAPRLAEARHSISVDFDARVLYAIKMAKARQSKQREEREAHERRRAAIAKQEVLDRELARQREIERKYGATRRRREMATERLGRVFAVQEHAAAGGVIGLSLLNLTTFQPLDMLTMLGFVILSGIVVNNAILLVHRTLQTIKNNNLSVNNAILDATNSRIRPIFMSTLTSVFGMLPLVVFPGAGSELYKGLGSVILGGLSLSAVLTLLIVPPMLKLFLQEKELIK